VISMKENNAPLDRPVRLKRLRMRAWRRGMKEMDIILGGFVDTEGPSLSDARLDALETLMNRQDQQLFRWVSGDGDVAPEDADAGECAIVADIKDAFRLTNAAQTPET